MAKTRAKKAITAATPAKAALRRLSTHGISGFAHHLTQMMTSDHIEGPHKARVDLRKLRTTLAAFRPIIRKPLYSRHQSQLRDLARIIGVLRDADVLAASFALPEFAAAAADQRLTTRALLTKLRAADTARRLTEAYGGKSWHRAGKKAKAARKSPVQPLAVKALDHAWRDCLGHGPDLTLLPEDQRHDLRKSLKTLRYLSDQFAPIWPERHGGFTTLLAGLQDDLGRLNDLSVARAHGLDAPDDPDLLAHAQTLWHRLHASPIWWTSA